MLSLCSAGQNRYLLHFNSFNSMVQWGSAVRLAMYEHTSLYEAYTGALIAGKGKTLNNVNAVMERTRFKHEDWARVRFGAGTPWQRCWFVVVPPDEKEMQKARKSLKRQSTYDKNAPMVKGCIRFYETKKTKKVKPIATVTNAYSAYSIYPQSTALIEQSTLVKIEGQITTHEPSDTTIEGLVFVMPETHAAVAGFETMLRFLVPTFDTFHLYGRPNRLIAATNHIKSIMFAFPKHRRYGYLDSLDIANLMQTPGSQKWTEAEWRQQLKEATMRRMSAASHSRTSSMSSTRPQYRAAMPERQSVVPPIGPPPIMSPIPKYPKGRNQSVDNIVSEKQRHAVPRPQQSSSSGQQNSDVSPLPSEYHLADAGSDKTGSGSTNYQSTSEKEWKQAESGQFASVRDDLVSPSPPEPVSNPPAFTHRPGQTPAIRPRPSVDARKANNRMSSATMAELAAASNIGLVNGVAPPPPADDGMITENVAEEEKLTNNPYATEARGLGVSDVNWRASSEVIAAPRPPVSPMHQSMSSSRGSQDTTPSAKNRLSLDTTKAVKRKPLPQNPSAVGFKSPANEPSLEDLRHTVDEDALNLVGSYKTGRSPMKYSPRDEDSVYDDMSPDYASTHESLHSRPSFREPKPRMGVMKTVGGATEGPKDQDAAPAAAPYELPPQSQPSADFGSSGLTTSLPDVDFGPTMTYLPTLGHPASSETLRGGAPSTNGSAGSERQRIQVPTHSLDTYQSSREERRRSMPWMASGNNSSMANLRSEQQHPHGSDPNLPLQRRGMPGPASSSPQKSGHRMLPDLPKEASSSQTRVRGPRNEPGAPLSAREQEHVARMTGSPFFNMVPGPNGPEQQQQQQINPRGLVGAIDARQREKRGMKEGMSNHMVQNAITQRQQHMQYPGPVPPSRTSTGPMYATEQQQFSGYNLPAAGRSVDRVNYPQQRADDPRRQSWYSAKQGPPPPPQGPPPAYYQQPNYTNLH